MVQTVLSLLTTPSKKPYTETESLIQFVPPDGVLEIEEGLAHINFCNSKHRKTVILEILCICVRIVEERGVGE